MEPDIIHEREGKYYFWDETWAYEHGPYDSEEEARKKLDEYVEVLKHDD